MKVAPTAAPALLVTVLLLGGCGAPPDAATTPATTPATTSAAAAPTVTADRIPADFPLLAGLPVHAPVEGDTYGPVGPGRHLPPLVPTACDDRVTVPDGVDLLRAGWTNVEDYRQRQLLAFATGAAASSYVDRVLDLYRSCPREEFDRGGGGARTVVAGSALGSQAGAVSVLSTFAGVPRPGLTTVHVVRVARFVLLATTSDEAGGGPRPYRDAARERTAGAAAIRTVVARMGALEDPEDES